MKIAIAKSLLEPAGIPWTEITSGENIELDKLVNGLIDEVVYEQGDMDALIKRLAERIRETDRRRQK